MFFDLLQRSSELLSRAVLVLFAVVVLAACSSTPQWAKPNTWVDGVFGPSHPSGTQTQPEQPQQYPNLADVPERPQDTSSAAERTQAVDGLIADRANAKH